MDRNSYQVLRLALHRCCGWLLASNPDATTNDRQRKKDENTVAEAIEGGPHRLSGVRLRRAADPAARRSALRPLRLLRAVFRRELGEDHRADRRSDGRRGEARLRVRPSRDAPTPRRGLPLPGVPLGGNARRVGAFPDVGARSGRRSPCLLRARRSVPLRAALRPGCTAAVPSRRKRAGHAAPERRWDRKPRPREREVRFGRGQENDGHRETPGVRVGHRTRGENAGCTKRRTGPQRANAWRS